MKASPPIPATRMVEVTKIFLVLPMSMCSLIIILTPEAAMNPYKRRETPPVTQVGMVWVRPMSGARKPKKMEKIQARRMTLTEAILVTPTTATFSPYVVLAAPHKIPEAAVAIPSPIKVLVRPGSLRRSL